MMKQYDSRLQLKVGEAGLLLFMDGKLTSAALPPAVTRNLILPNQRRHEASFTVHRCLLLMVYFYATSRESCSLFVGNQAINKRENTVHD